MGFAESQAAAVKHTVISIKNKDGDDKEISPAHKCDGCKTRARAHTVMRMTAKVSDQFRTGEVRNPKGKMHD
jgi:hypothetical protein